MHAESEELERKQPESKTGWWRWCVASAAVAFVLYHLLYISDFLIMYTPLRISPPLHVGIHLASVLSFTFLLVPAKGGMKRDKPPVYDVVLAFASLVIPLYYGLLFDEIYMTAGDRVLYAIFGWILSILLLEAARRLLGIPFTIVVTFFLFYPLFSGYMPGPFFSPSISLFRAGQFFLISSSAILGFILWISATIIVPFLLFSQLFLKSGAGKFFIDLAYSGFGTVRGGPAKMAVIGSALFGTLSGSPAANVAATGTFTIPLMKKTGYAPHYAGAVETVASLGGILMPPVMGSLAFVLADFIGMPYIEVIKHAVVPAIFYYVALYLMIDQEAIRLGLRGLSKETVPSLWKTLKKGWWYGIPVVVLVYLMAVLLLTPQKSVIWAMVSLMALSMFRKETRLSPVKLVQASEQTLRAVLMVAVAMACAGIITGAVSLTGVGLNVARGLTTIAGGNVAVLLGLAAIASFVMGMGVGPTGCYVFLAVIVAPALTMLGVPNISAHLFLYYWAMVSLITPPVAVLANVAAAFAECHYMKVAWQATRLGVVLYFVPFAFAIKPALLLVGTPIEVAVAVISVAIGVVGLSFGVGGRLLGKLSWPQRLMCLSGGLLIMFANSLVFMGSGAFILGIAFFWQWQKRRGGMLKS